MSLSWVSESDVRAAIADVRNDKTPTDWMLIKYEGPKSQKLTLAGSGTGGIAELAAQLEPSDVGFGLVRRVDKIDDSETVKFGFILYIGDKVPIMQKARISVHSGPVKDFIGNFHVDMMVSTTEELSEEALVRKIQDASGSGTHVLEKGGARQAVNVSTPSKGGSRVVPKSETGALTFPSNEVTREVRAGTDGLNWVLYGYEGGNSNNVVLLNKGTGGIPEMVDNLNDEIVAYGLVRLIERVDESDTVKFVFINWVGDNIPRMLRARIGTHTGAVKDFIGQYHTDISATSKSEVAEDVIVSRVKKAAGTAVHVLDTPVSSSSPSIVHTPSRSTPGASGTKMAAMPTQAQGAKMGNEPEIKAAVADVRSDATDTNWVLITYESANSNSLKLLGKGNGGADELIEHLQDDIVAYGLVRASEAFELTSNVRFAFINWIGENIPRMQRARLGTHSGAVKDIFNPYHVDLNPTNRSEISAEIVANKIKSAMGTANLIRDK